MDGVIVDTMDLHFEAGAKVLNRAGAKVSKSDLRTLDSTRSRDGFRKFLASKSDGQIQALVAEKYRYLLLKTRGIKPIPGFLDFFFLVKGKYRLAVVSSSIRAFVDHILGELAIKDSFEAIIGGDDISRGKPDPEGYLAAAKKLGVKPANCVVIEDSLYGIMSAKAAGMKVIAVTNTYDRNFLLDADLIVDSLSEISVEALEGLFNA